MERRQDIVLGLIFMGIGIATAWMATSYKGASGNYPTVLGIILTLIGGIVATKAVRLGSVQEREPINAPIKMITALAAALLYVALIVPLGFYTSSFLLMLALPAALGFRQLVDATTVAVIFILVVYLIFSVLLEKPLPRGALLSPLGFGG